MNSRHPMLLVVAHGDFVKPVQRLFDREDVFVCGPNGSIMGRRFRSALVNRPTDYICGSEVRTRTFSDWIETSVRTRIMPGGELVFA